MTDEERDAVREGREGEPVRPGRFVMDVDDDGVTVERPAPDRDRATVDEPDAASKD